MAGEGVKRVPAENSKEKNSPKARWKNACGVAFRRRQKKKFGNELSGGRV